MTIIVTGGAGFIGSNFVFHMLNTYPDYRIICVDKLTYAGNLSTLEPVMDNPNFRFCKIDICDRDAIYELFEDEHPDMVVNFAAESHVDRSIENPEVFLNTNILGTAVLMDACRKYGIKRYHQVSTDEVYGDLPLDRPDLFFTEKTPIHTSSPYSSSKAGADLLVLAYHRTYGLPVTISRCSNNYGPYHFPEKLIPLMIANALIGLSGAMASQSVGYSDINTANGTLIYGLAAVIIGEAIFGKRGAAIGVISAVTGSVIYKLIVAFVIRQNLFGDKSANLMKLTCALIVAITLAIPAIKEKIAEKRSRKAEM